MPAAGPGGIRRRGRVWLANRRPALFESGGDIALCWILQLRDEFWTPPDSNGFTAYCPSAVCTQVGQWTPAYRDGQRELPPVAEVDVLMTVVGEPGSVDLLANDVQSEPRVEAGELSVSDGVLTLTPADGFTGRGEITYVVSDAEGLVSELAMVTLRVSEPERRGRPRPAMRPVSHPIR